MMPHSSDSSASAPFVAGELASSSPAEPFDAPLEQVLGDLFHFLSEQEGNLAHARDTDGYLLPDSSVAAGSRLPDSVAGVEANERLRSLLWELLGLDEQPVDASDDLASQVQQLTADLYDPQTLGQLLLPAFQSLLTHQATSAPEETARILAQLVDRMIAHQAQQEPVAMSKALAVTIPGAISKRLGDAPHEVIQALAPAMGRAIMAQVRLDRDSMVDALYPVIGNTISKYMGEVIHQINARLEATFSLRGLMRQLWLRLRGVSEAELILREALPFEVQAVFLIHKSSGLVIAEVQQSGDQALEADLLAGMLTAIRSFASECATGQGHRSELTKIDYEDLQIIMEVAGACYLAAVVRGEAPATFGNRLRQVLSAIILNHGYGEGIENFNGDMRTVPESIPELLQTLLLRQGVPQRTPELGTALDSEEFSVSSRRRFPVGIAIATGLLLLPSSVWAWGQWRMQQLRQGILATWADHPELSVYRLEAAVSGQQVTLRGVVPSPEVQEWAATVLLETVGDRAIDNQIRVQNLPPELGVLREQVQQAAAIVNQLLAIEIATSYDPETQNVLVQTPQLTPEQLAQVTEAFRQVQGVRSVVITTANVTELLSERIYFDLSDVAIASTDYQDIIAPLARQLKSDPQMGLTIIGHTDSRGEERYNESLARRRALAVQTALIAQGIAPERLFIRGDTNPPPQVQTDDPLSKSRCVRFERVELAQ